MERGSRVSPDRGVSLGGRASLDWGMSPSRKYNWRAIKTTCKFEFCSLTPDEAWWYLSYRSVAAEIFICPFVGFLALCAFVQYGTEDLVGVL